MNILLCHHDHKKRKLKGYLSVSANIQGKNKSNNFGTDSKTTLEKEMCTQYKELSI